MKPYLKDGKFDGQGILTHEGEEYVGGFKDDKPHGQGTHTDAMGKKYSGKWKDGEFLG